MANAKGDSGDRDRKGRIIGRSKLTERQAVFLELLKKGEQQTKAAELAGYRHPHVVGSQLLKAGTVAELVKRGKRKIISQTAGAGLLLIRDIVSGRANPSRVQFDAAKFAIELEQRLEGEGKEANNGGALRDLTLKELEAMAARVNSARTVAAVPELPASAVQVIDPEAEPTP